MNPADTNQVCSAKIDASCRVPLLVTFGFASLWLVLGLAFALIASITFHKPDNIFAGCSCLTYGHTVAVANDLLVYGFTIPAALGVMLWIFARLSQAELALPIVPVAAAHLWNLGVLAGVATIFGGGSSGYTWLEFPRVSAALLGVSFVLFAISAVATFAQRQERELYPSHWFLLAALLWFPWIYSTANLFIVTTHPVRGVAQGVINWWYADNLIFVWLALVGLGTAFYFIPKISGQPLKSRFYALFAFWTLILFGTWIGIPEGAPVPAWLPTTSAFASYMLLIPIIAVAVVLVKTLWGAKVDSMGGTYYYLRFGSFMFLVSALMLVVQACPQHGSILEFTWFGQAQAQLQILGFAGMILCGAIHEILPRIMDKELPFKKFVQGQFWLSLLGLALYIIPLAIAGVKQGNAAYDPTAAKVPLMICTTGLLLVLLGSVLMFVNIFVMTFKWKIALAKSVYAAVTAPLESSEVKS
jgi:cytochrome c oxidase cbb3-type subunit 1